MDEGANLLDWIPSDLLVQMKRLRFLMMKKEQILLIFHHVI